MTHSYQTQEKLSLAQPNFPRGMFFPYWGKAHGISRKLRDAERMRLRLWAPDSISA